MRKVVVKEGFDYPDRRHIEKGALTPHEHPWIPVVLANNFDTLVGRARGFERNEETGEISFDIEITHQGFDKVIDSADLFDAWVSIYPFDIQANNHITHGVIRQITIALLPAHIPTNILE